MPKILITLLLCTLTPALAAEENLLLLESPRVNHGPTKPQGEFYQEGAIWKLTPPPRTAEGRNEFRVGFSTNTPLDPAAPLIFECELRAGPAEGERSVGQAGLIFDVATLPREGAKRHTFFQHILLAGPDWETFTIPLEPDGQADAGDWEVALIPGHFNQTVELRGIRLRKLREGESPKTSASYSGQELDAPWRKIAAEKIAQHRMGDLHVEITDAHGKPIVGAVVTLRQLRHAYRFGTCVNAARLVDAEIKFRDPQMTREQFLADNKRYREEFLRLFNYAVFENDLKWPNWEESRHQSTQISTLAGLRWLQQHHIPTKGHTLVWGSWSMSPKWLRSLEGDPAALQQAILRHIRDVGTATAPFTVAWDVLNEPMSHRDIIELLGPEAVAEWFRTARTVLPGQTLLLNEFDMVGNGGSPQRRRDVVALVKELQKRGGAPDVLGFQSHFWSSRPRPPRKSGAFSTKCMPPPDSPSRPQNLTSTFRTTKCKPTTPGTSSRLGLPTPPRSLSLCGAFGAGHTGSENVERCFAGTGPPSQISKPTAI